MLALSFWSFVWLVLGSLEFHAGVVTKNREVRTCGYVTAIAAGMVWSVTAALFTGSVMGVSR